MIVKFFAYVRDDDYAGCKETSIEAPHDLRALGHELSERYGARFHDFFFSEDETEIGSQAIVIVNGRHSQFLSGLDTVLSDSDTVLIFPVVAGG